MPAPEYRSTLNLPRTDFPMAAGLTKLEPALQKRWDDARLYEKVRERRLGREKWILHDGPPYANGDVHVGTGQNKILKDLIVRYRTMRGFDSPYVPGWDCHGLPIERKVLTELGAAAASTPPAEIRRRCRNFASKYLDLQRRQFRALGCIGDWDRPYTTFDPSYEAAILAVFEDLVRGGYVYRGKRSIHWCMVDKTALAEAEIEYKDKPSPSIYLRFAAADGETDFLVWTTTPWTLPGNVAVAAHPELEYALVEYESPAGKRRGWLCADLVERLRAPLRLGAVGQRASGSDLAGRRYRHPIHGGECPVVLARYVRLDQGTGLVHTAPGHGEEDFATGLEYKLPIVSPVDNEGRFTDEVPAYRGLTVWEAQPRITADLKARGILLREETIQHSYPCCWRCKEPVIFRATEQWFLKIDHADGRRRALEAISKVKWVPAWGETRIRSMVEARPDWCISRQRYWGVPIPAFYCRKCDDVLLTAETARAVREFVARRGCDAWFTTPESEILPPGTKCAKCGGAAFRKENDIFDVWFESAASHRAVVMGHPALAFPADLYIEGTDQHRGWFQVSLWASLLTNGKAPFKTVVTHGFLKEAETRQKISKSGFLIPAEEVTKKLGADLMRLWIASIDFTDDIPISWEILQSKADPYRKIRNTIRFLLSNLYDFDPARERVDVQRMRANDRFALYRLNEVIADVTKFFEEYQFFRATQDLHTYCVVDLSAGYLDLLKDRLYCTPATSPERWSAQAAVYEIASALIRMLAPILAHTAEEAWGFLPGTKGESVHLAEWPRVRAEWTPSEVEKKQMAWLAVARPAANKHLEELRAAKKIGQSIDAEVTLPATPEAQALAADLAEALNVSAVHWGDGDVRAAPSAHPKCARCWRRLPAAKPDLCARCAAVLG